MEENIIKVIFPKYYNYIQELKDTVNIGSTQINELQLRNQQLMNIVKNINIFLAKETTKVLEIEPDKNGDLVIVYKKKDKYNFDIFIKNDSILNHTHDLYLKTTYEDLYNLIHIDDIDGGTNCIGYGSIAMKKLINIARENGITKLYGEISPVDWDHIDRLEHFYKKFNFNVSLNHKSKSGKIELIL